VRLVDGKSLFRGEMRRSSRSGQHRKVQGSWRVVRQVLYVAVTCVVSGCAGASPSDSSNLPPGFGPSSSPTRSVAAAISPAAEAPSPCVGGLPRELYSDSGVGVLTATRPLQLTPGFCKFTVSWSAYCSSCGSFYIAAEAGGRTLGSDRSFNLTNGARGEFTVTGLTPRISFYIAIGGQGNMSCNPSRDVMCIGWTVTVTEVP
jgi:hypothetical protein